MGSTILCLYSEPEIRLYQSVRSVEQDVMSGEAEKCLIFSVFFSAVFGAEIRPHFPRQKVCFFPYFERKFPSK